MQVDTGAETTPKLASILTKLDKSHLDGKIRRLHFYDGNPLTFPEGLNM